MDTIFLLISLTGLVYFCLLVVFRHRTLQGFGRLRIQPLHHERLKRLLADAGLRWNAAHVQAVRFGVAAVFPIVAFSSAVLFHERLTPLPLVGAVFWLIGTSPFPFSPFGLLIHLRKKHADAKRDGEWIAFLRLYENNRRNKQRRLQFAAFCEQVAAYLPLLRHDLLLLSQRVTVGGLDAAFEWLAARFPAGHPFVHEVFAIVQTTERLGSEEAVRFLQENSRVLAKLSSDQYERRWKSIGQWLNLLNTLPAMATFLMMLVLVLLYVSLIKSRMAP